MGAIFESRTVQACGESELKKAFGEIVQEDEEEYGDDGYTGSFAEATGLSIKNKVFEDRKSAENWIADNSEKWGPAVAVQYKTGSDWEWLIGGWFSS